MPTLPPRKDLDLSVLIRTFNEADRIASTIHSVKDIATEIIVIDSGSTDRTVEQCESLGARVIVNPWPGFGPQRHFGEEQCSRRYVFSLDADEVVTPAMAAEISRVLGAPRPPALLIVRKAMVFPHHQKPPPWDSADEQILIYDKSVARTEMNPNWDKLEISEPDRPLSTARAASSFFVPRLASRGRQSQLRRQARRRNASAEIAPRTAAALGFRVALYVPQILFPEAIFPRRL